MSVNLIGGSYIVMNSFLPLGSNSLHAIWIYIWTLKSECSYQDYDPSFALLLVFSWLDLWSPIDPNNCNVISCQYGLACFWNVLQLPTCIVLFHAIYLWLFTVFGGWFSMHCRWFFQLYRDFLQLSVPAPMVPPLCLPLPSVYLFGALSSFVYVHGCPNIIVSHFFSNVVFLSLVTWQICVPHLIPSHAIIYPYYLNNVGLLFSLKFLWVNEWIFEGWEFASSAGCHAWMPLLAVMPIVLDFIIPCQLLPLPLYCTLDS